jgi:hypothetical protein
MPKLTKGCYSKCGYPDDLHVQGYTLHFLASGCTRQVYDIEQLPDAVAKVMPSRRSIHWKEGYEQNEVEFEALRKLQSLEGAPKIFVYEESAAFINVCGQIGFANLLVVSKLGQDLQAAAGQINLREYICGLSDTCSSWVLSSQTRIHTIWLWNATAAVLFRATSAAQRWYPRNARIRS